MQELTRTTALRSLVSCFLGTVLAVGFVCWGVDGTPVESGHSDGGVDGGAGGVTGTTVVGGLAMVDGVESGVGGRCNVDRPILLAIF